MKIVAPENLKMQSLGAEIVDSHISKWHNGEHFCRFRKNPRPFSALFFVFSDMECIYSETDKTGNEIVKVSCKKGDILYIPQDVTYHAFFFTAEGERETCTLNFHLYDPQGETILLSTHITRLQNKLNPFMTEDLLNVHRWERTPMICDKLRINSVFFSVLYYATRSTPTAKNHTAVEKAVHAIEEEWNQNEKMGKYAELCRMSETYFYREFRALTGTSPVKYRNDIRINAAISDIHNTNLSIREISRRVGFEDEFYFSRLFKKATGLSPQDFKKS